MDRNVVSWLILILYWLSVTVLTRENSLVRTVADTQKKIKIKREKSGRGRGWQGGRRHHEALRLARRRAEWWEAAGGKNGVMDRNGMMDRSDGQVLDRKKEQ
jgi:hypothetical protein